ncbi:MAG: RNA polymerase sigma factor [Bdellovibrionaceae bacterium]|nr:RNA polymerase sigma factor [Pseudobdellovibrionaceae bacterium]
MIKITSHTTDEELMNLYLQAHTQAFNELYRRHSGKLLTYLKKKVSPEVAEDLLQNTFTRLYTAKHTYKDNYLFLPWLFTIARNTLLDYYKKPETRISNNTVELSEDIQNPEAIESFTNNDIPQLLYNLTPQQRQVFELRYLHDWSFEQIGKMTATSPANIRQIISRGLKKIKTIKVSDV